MKTAIESVDTEFTPLIENCPQVKQNGHELKIGVIYICTGKYRVFWKDFVASAEKYFLPLREKHYFIFTDAESLTLPNSRCVVIPQPKLGWPHDTLKRYHVICANREILAVTDFLFFVNANLIFKRVVGDEVLPAAENHYLVGVQHPGFYDKRPDEFTYERDGKSTAYIPFGRGAVYYMGGLIGGRTPEFLSMSQVLRSDIQSDLDNNVIAVWHDESHLNKFLLDQTPLKLSPAYGYPEHWKLPFEEKITILDKSRLGGHAFLRGQANPSRLVSVASRVRNLYKSLRVGYGNR